jgi:MoaA/NifB/PqqE/SkfB family radical SAM enzyme
MSGPAEREDLSIEVLSRCLEDAARLGYRQLSISGGEPLLYKPLAELLACGRRLGMLTTLTSNGMLLTRERWEPLGPLVDLIAISIDGRPAEHDLIRGRQGAFAKTVENFQTLRSSGVPFGIIFTLTQHNVDSLEFVVRLAAENGARGVQVHPLTLHGRAAIELPGERPDGLELVAALAEAARLGAELGVAVHVDALTVDQLLSYREHLVPQCPVRNPVEVAPVLIVEPDGSIMPLTHELNRAFQIGSLRNELLSALVRDWLASGRADKLAKACERTWNELAGDGCDAIYWYDEVAARTNQICQIDASTQAFSSKNEARYPV